MEEEEEEIEIVIHPCDGPIPEPKPMGPILKEPKYRETDEYGCKECVWGIKDMQDNIPIYCTCEHGRRHTEPQPWLARLGERFVNFMRGFKN